MYLKKAIRRDCSPILKNGSTRLLTYLKKSNPSRLLMYLKSDPYADRFFIMHIQF